MDVLETGQWVKMAIMPDLVFKIIQKNADGSFEIEAQLGNEQTINYGNIAPEMLRKMNHSL